MRLACAMAVALLACDATSIGRVQQSIVGGWGDPRDYGAVIDDDCATAADNAIAVQYAADAGPMQMPVGELCVDGSISLSYPVQGFGWGSILKAHSPGAQERLLVIDGKSGIYVRDLQLDGNGDNAAPGEHAANLFVTGSTDILISNVWTHDAQGDGIHIHSASTGWSARVTVRDCYATNRGRASISVTGFGASGVTITGNRLLKGIQPTSTTVSQGAGIGLEPNISAGDLTGTELSGNTVEGIIAVTHQDGSIWRGMSIVDNRIDGLELHRAQDFVIARNAVGSFGILIQDHGTPATGHGTISDNNVSGTISHGITLSASPSAGMLLGDIIITRNSIRDTAGHGIALAVPAVDLIVAGNTITDIGGTGISLLGPINFQISGNTIYDVGTIGIAVNSALGAQHGPGLISGNSVDSPVNTGKTGLQLSAPGSGLAYRILATGNDLIGAHSEAYAIRDTGTSQYCHGRENRKTSAGDPISEAF